MIKLIDLAGYKLIENENKNIKTYTIIRFGIEEKKVKTLKEAIEYIYLEEMKYINDFSWKGNIYNDKTE